MEPIRPHSLKSIAVEEVIITTLVQRGDGKETPIRNITQVFTKAGDLIAENDPDPDKPADDKLNQFGWDDLQEAIRELAMHIKVNQNKGKINERDIIAMAENWFNDFHQRGLYPPRLIV